MYETHYGFTGLPFQLTPDARFFYGSGGHRRAIAHLTFGLAQGEGFIILTGEVGAGKSLLIERLMAQINRGTYSVAHVNTTRVSGDDLFRLSLAGFGVNDAAAAKATLLLRFEEALHDHRVAGRRCLLIVDEAQNLSLAALEELRMLANLVEGGQPSLQTILMGQPQFRRMLASSEMEQLRQRVLSSYHLGPLTRAETRAYIEHRLTTVGWHGDNPAWQDTAYTAVYDHTSGIPRRINRLCGRMLVYGVLEQQNTITGSMVGSAAKELEDDLGGGPVEQIREPRHDSSELLEGRSAEIAELRSRVDELERQMTRREKMFQRLIDMFGAGSSAGKP